MIVTLSVTRICAHQIVLVVVCLPISSAEKIHYGTYIRTDAHFITFLGHNDGKDPNCGEKI